MRWRGERQSDNVEDRRGVSRGGLVLGGGGTLIVLVIAMLMGADPRQILQQLQSSAVETQQPAPGPAGAGQAAANDEAKAFVATVLGSTEDVWREQFKKLGRNYQEPALVLFTDATESACGRCSNPATSRRR